MDSQEVIKQSSLRQFAALMKRNIRLKIRNKSQTIQEFLTPVYYVVILIIIKVAVKPQEYPAISKFPTYSLGDPMFVANKSMSIFVSPGTNDVINFMDKVATLLDTKISTYEFFDTQEDAENTFINNRTLATIAIDFHVSGSSVENYTIRTPKPVSANTDSWFSSPGQCREFNGADPANCGANQYLYSGFALLQLAVDTILYQNLTSEPNVPLPDIRVQLFPKDSWVSDTMFIQLFSSIYFVLAYSPFINFLLVNLVTEKEKKIREGMKMMGLKDASFWFSWGITYFIIILISTLVCVGISWNAKLFAQSDFMLFFIIMLLYGMSIITMGFMLTPFFDKAQKAGALASFATVLFSLLYLPISLTRTTTATGPASAIPPGGQWALCLLSPVALALAVDQGLYLDIARGGMTWDKLSEGEFPLYALIIMLVVDFILYGLLAVYFDNVIQGEYGQRKPLYFCFMPSYWCQGNDQVRDQTNYSGESNGKTMDDEDIEPIAEQLKNKNALRLDGVSKLFRGDDDSNKLAVNDVTLDMYEGQITCLLGHNGAGKTTIINILTGTLAASKGKASIYGLDTSKPNDLERIRSMTGVCPQHNILFDQLTAAEHLQFYAAIKGVRTKYIDGQVTQALKDVDMFDQKHTLSTNLSGGQKRKLSVAIALIGDPKVIFLDEPTAGMDPYSRRHLWSILKERKEGRLILLTTHFMDEADLLADRKAIISKGTLKCVGSSLFLKTKFGAGYHLNMVVDQTTGINQVTSFVRQYVPDAESGRSHGKEITVTLPVTSVDKFADLFSGLEKKEGSQSAAEGLGIRNYGISMTTLEEVFLKIGELEEIDDSKDINDHIVDPGDHVHIDIPSNGNTNLIKTMETDEKKLRLARYRSLLKFKFDAIKRMPVIIVFRIVIPLLMIIASLCMQRFIPIDNALGINTLSPLELNASEYVNTTSYPGQPKTLFQVMNAGVETDDFLKALEGDGYQTTEVESSTDLIAMAPHHVLLNITDVVPLTSTAYRYQGIVTYNDTATHSLPVALHMITTTLRRMSVSSASEVGIRSHPYPGDEINFSSLIGQTLGAVLLVGMAVTFIPSGFGVTVVVEREKSVRSLYRLAGITMNTYWLATITLDLIQFFAIAFGVIILLAIFQVPGYMYGGAMLSLIILTLLYVPMATMLSYVLSFGFDKTETVSTVLPNVFIWVSFLPSMPVLFLDMFQYVEAARIIHIVMCCVNPPYIYFGAFYYIMKVYFYAAIIQFPDTPSIPLSRYFEFDTQIPIALIMPAVHLIWLYFALRMLEIRKYGGSMKDVCNFSGEIKPTGIIPQTNDDLDPDEDDDVKAERQRVEGLNIQSEETVIAVHGLRREFQKSAACKSGPAPVKVAVRNVTFAVDKGEVFGLLGPNGAGKTTVMNMMIAEVGPTKGKITVNGYDVRSSLSAAFGSLGYCPQHDALAEMASLREHLIFFATSTGVSEDTIQSTIDYYINALQLEEHADKITKKLSGGTKRKVNYIISLMGDPKVVLMDEPSTGMDPKSKRFLWDTISSTFNATQKGAILTTHYMEEADALCTRLAIMVNGQMMCHGTTQHLKNKYGSGYILEIKLKTESEQDTNSTGSPNCDRSGSRTSNRSNQDQSDSRMANLDRFVLYMFPNCVNTETFGERTAYKIPQSDINSLGQIFSQLEQAKSKYSIEEYSFSQSTLEQVFLEFAKKQMDEHENDLPTSQPPSKQNSPTHQSSNL